MAPAIELVELHSNLPSYKKVSKISISGLLVNARSIRNKQQWFRFWNFIL